ncbi:class I SAM-dependent methyltransferase [Pseudonocardia sp. TRM90224]|uniref:class I SAM-dependent methyltransferase n=1 Tax=Pseudonocardia sp. TRM90224 TaxID=2812678 RepID=UPI001E3A17D4|nr:class I SAM-dependent methyltransferase [Pseudonocardia sp. TRM90224]
MPTLPEPHRHRDTAESFGTNAARYDRTRPSYPDAMVAAIVAAGPGPGVLDVLDVGCGTGISSRQFVAAGCRMLGVDADPRMAEFARGTGLDVEVARFEDWEAAGRTFDLVVAGQTWHWVDPVAGAAKAATVLRPAGRLAVFWNVAQPPEEVAEAFAEVYRRVLPDSPFGTVSAQPLDAYAPGFTTAAHGMRACGAFGEPAHWRYEWERLCTRDEWLDVVPTHGGHNLLPPAQLTELVDGFGAAIDAAGGSFPMSYTTVVVTAALN